TIKDEEQNPFFIAGELDQEGNPIHVKIKIVPIEFMEKHRLHRDGIDWFQRKFVSADSELIYRKIKTVSIALSNVFNEIRQRLADTHTKLYTRVMQPLLDECCYYYNQKVLGKDEIQICNDLVRLSMNSFRFRSSNPTTYELQRAA